MISLGIESTAHTFGVGLVDSSGKVLYESRDVFSPKKGQGFVPNDLADHHNKVAAKILNGIDMKKVGLVSFSRGPGIPNALMVGSSVARYIARKHKKPIVGVNHAVAHIEIGRLTTGSKDPVVVYLSGGNTQIIAHADGRYRVFGESEDIPVGNLFDVFARESGLKTPGGPEIERLAKRGSYIELPYVVKGMDLSFTGILTSAIRRREMGTKIEDLCYSLQETAFAMITEVSERALAHTGRDEILLVGGVASNERLRKMMKTMCEDRGARMFAVPKKYATDNGVMIGWAGLLRCKSKGISAPKVNIDPKWRTDDVEISWYNKKI